MTDVEERTPAKRRLPEKKGPTGAKKQKISPKKQDKKLNKPNNVQNSNEKPKGNKKNIENKNGSPKKLKPFVGTSKITSNEQLTEGNKKVAQQNKEKREGKKPRRNLFTSLKDRIHSEEKDAALKSIEEKIKAIETRGELTKTARRKLKLLHRLKRMGGGESDVQSQPQKVINNKSEQKNRNEGKKKKGLEAIKTAPLNIGKKKTALQGQKTNELNQKRLAVENQQVNKKIKNLKVEKEESSDEDEESENELEEGDESGSDEEIDEEQDEIEADDDSGDEEEVDEEESDEAEGSEDEESDDESEEDSPPPQVSNKKQKKK